MRVLFFIIISVVVPINVYAADLKGTVTGRVINISTHLENWQSVDLEQDVNTHIYIQGLPVVNSGKNGCVTSGGYARVGISKKNPAYKEFVSMALFARASGLNVTAYYLDSCTIRGNSWDLGILTL